MFNRQIRLKIVEARFVIETGPGVDELLHVNFIDDGGGHFVEIGGSDTKVRLDPDEFLAIATWAKSVCVELDKGEA